MEIAIRYFSIFGSLEWDIDIDKPLEELIENEIFTNFHTLKTKIDSILVEDDLELLLHAIAVGDRKMFSSFKKAHLNEFEGGISLNKLQLLNILGLEHSRESEPQKEYSSQKLKKEIVKNRITHKLYFKSQFLRFWFYFVYPFYDEISEQEYKNFFTNFNKHLYSYISFTFEELSNLLLEQTYADKIVEKGSYWDRRIELDVLALSENGKLIAGECKWKNHKITKKELGKIKDKCNKINLDIDTYALFSKRGFSNELLSIADDKLLLFGAEDFEELVKNTTIADLLESSFK
ncbi:MAG: DUF234 domain-containing protein [Helicobacteraceae bacterium]|nr:DUF234 domain-containing protein [Helicobacteraceae bacterium]